MGICCSKKLSIWKNRHYKRYRPKNLISKKLEEPCWQKSSNFGLTDLYERVDKENLDRTTGRTNAKVYLMQNIRTNQLVAIKVFLLPKNLNVRVIHCLKREIEIQATLCERNFHIVKIFELVLTDSNLCLVLEYMQGESLAEYLDKKTVNTQKNSLTMSEDEALYFFRQILSVVKFCHNHNVMHRDIKLNNILLDDSIPPNVKLCDFGFAKAWSHSENGYSSTIIGTPVYMSPEVLTAGVNHRSYDGKLADIWSLGVLLFVMLFGDFPFEENPKRLKLRRRNYYATLMEVYWQQATYCWSDCTYNPHIKDLINVVSKECKNVLDRILEVDVRDRIRINEIRKHKWFKRKQPIRVKKSSKKWYINKSKKCIKFLNGPYETSRRARVVKIIIDDAHEDNAVMKGEYFLVPQKHVKRINFNTETRALNITNKK